MSNDIKAKAGRKWKYDKGGVSSLSVPYRVILDGDIAVGSEGKITGLPAIGSEHDTNENLVVASVDVDEPSGSDRKVLSCTVNYEKKDDQDQSDAGSTEEPEGYACDEWGWSSGTEQKDLTEAANSTTNNRILVLNSAGDPFENVPKVSISAPIFSKVMRFETRQSSAMGFDCKVNDTAITIGSVECPVGSLLCSVSEKLIFGDEKYRYQYNVQLKKKSNFVIPAGESAKRDIGWDVAIVDAGMRALTTVPGFETEQKRICRVIDKETGKLCKVTSATLLDGNGHQISPTDPNQDGRNLVFQAYERATFPAWFYSEPQIIQSDDDDE